MSDGVACEACHGPAEKWLGPHTAADNTHEGNVALGMLDTKKLDVRAQGAWTAMSAKGTRRSGTN